MINFNVAIFILAVVTLYEFTTCYADLDKTFALSDYVKQYVLDLHNNFRREVAKGNAENQPPTDNMPDMIWDDGLADFAQQLTSTCNFNHRYDREVEGYGQVGENLYMGGISNSMETDDDLNSQFAQSIGPTNDPDPGRWGWTDEYRRYDYSSNSCSEGDCGHYTQIVWAKSDKVGCAISQCNGVSGSFMTELGFYVVCNYSPAGNFNGESPY